MIANANFTVFMLLTAGLSACSSGSSDESMSPVGMAGAMAPSGGMGPAGAPSTTAAASGGNQPPGAGTTGGVIGGGGTSAPTAGTTGMGGSAGMEQMSGAGGMAGAMVTAGSGGQASGAGGDAGSAGSMPPVPTGAPMPCIANGREVLVVGDSYIAYINPLVPPLEAKAKADGQLTGNYTNLAVPGTFIDQIEGQWQSGKSGKPKFVIMDGGGNDVLLGAPQCLTDGSDMDAGCRAVVDGAVVTGKRMIADMKASGVAGLLYFFYPNVPAGGKDILAYALPQLKQECESVSDQKFKCAFVDTRALFEPHPDYFFIDGIHPSASGAEALAGLVWSTLKENCLAQASGCCM